MSEPHSVTGSSSRSKRILVGLGFLFLVTITLALAWWCYVWTQAANRLRAAIATLDQRDPGWRWDELQAKRVAVPDSENSELRVAAASKLLPKDWPGKTVDPDSESDPKTIVDQIRDVDPVTQLRDTQIQELRTELGKVQPALDEARKLVGMPAGRFPAIRPEEVLSGSYMDKVQEVRRLANLLSADAALLAQDQQPDSALASSRAVLNAGRCIGDDPVAIAQLVRMACRRLAAISTERILAQGQPSERALRASQQLLQDEEQQPLLLYALRGERAYSHEQMAWMEAGDTQRMAGSALGTGWLERLQMRLAASWTRQQHVRTLETMTEAVEIAKLPLEEQARQMKTVQQRLKAEADTPQGSSQILATLAFPVLVKLSDAFTRSRAELRCAIAALAAERYRLEHHAWPDSLDQLVPEFLPEVPRDPYDRKPLRYKRLEDGVAIYSVGPDGKDDGGKVDRKNYTAPGTDMVFRLWNVDRRRQAVD